MPVKGVILQVLFIYIVSRLPILRSKLVETPIVECTFTDFAPTFGTEDQRRSIGGT